ncbi:MAG: hypothetical protein JWQ07_845 [Ramlibacter sp.]|nr:hypothetical protein [Ramlibacter sp.]
MMSRLAIVLLMGLAALVAGAQPARPGAAVDSRAECAALEGTWKQAGDSWHAACEVPWSREDCLRLGGAWTQVAKASAGGHCLAGVSEFGTAQQCLDHGGNWGPAGSRAPQCSFESAKARPTARKAPDAGKLCDSQRDCTHGCVYDGPTVAPKTDVMGHCRATNIASGCFSMVESGRLAGRICVK